MLQSTKRIYSVTNNLLTKVQFRQLSYKTHYLQEEPKHSTKSTHPIYHLQNIETINETHKKPADFKDRLALNSIRLIRKTFDLATGYNENKMSVAKWLNRCIFLETVAAVPGMVGGMT